MYFLQLLAVDLETQKWPIWHMTVYRAKFIDVTVQPEQIKTPN